MSLCIRIALLILIMRVFGAVHKRVLLWVYIFIAFMIVYYFASFLVKLFICWPIRAVWDGPESKCLDQHAIFAADAAISTLTDSIVLLLPTPLAWSLQLPVRQRIRIIALLCAGGIAVGFSIYCLTLVLSDGRTSNQTLYFAKLSMGG